jgi:prolyl-tRNA editing enzyme YbaK/EbsC (Cys-tRNA(Pro) deacylase)
LRDKVIDSAQELGLEVDIRRLPAVCTPAEAAAAVGCGERRITRSTVFVADGDPVLCVTCGADPVDADSLAQALDVAEVRLATSREVRAATGFSPELMPAVGHGLPIVLDEAVLEFETVWTAGGDGRSVVEIAPRRLASATAATIAPLAA